MKNNTHRLLSTVLLSLSLAGCAGGQADKKQYTVKFLNLDGSEICSKVYVEGHTIVPPDDIRDYDIKEECRRYFFKGYYDGQTCFNIGTKATKDVTYQAKFDIKDKHIFESVTYTWAEEKEHEDECKAEAVCKTCSKTITETGWSIEETEKDTRCYKQYHYKAFFDTLGFEEQTSDAKREIKGEHAFTKMWAKDTIGHSGTFYCDYCGDINPDTPVEKTSPSTAEEVNFAFDTFGATATLVGASGAYEGEDELLSRAIKQDINEPGVLLFDTSAAEDFTTGYAEIEINLPKVDYSLYSKVTYGIQIDDANYGVSFNRRSWIEPGTEGAIQGQFIAAELNVCQEGSEYKAYITGDGKTVEKPTSLSEDVVNGENSLPLYLNSMFFRDIKITKIALESK
ncbi:MAG: hypothetical protein MJ239_03555 [Bacilli bacterium]|nr:hypothetical protein [Bacilli bacterium]